MKGRTAAIAAVVAVVAYLLWIAAVADDFGAPSTWTILSGAVSLLALVVVLIYIVTRLYRLIRSRS